MNFMVDLECSYLSCVLASLAGPNLSANSYLRSLSNTYDIRYEHN